MKFLITTFGGMFTGLFGQFLLLFGRKYSVATASVLAYIAATLAMIVCMKGIILSVLAAIVMPEWLLTGIAWIIPSNFVQLFSLIMSGRICRAAYDAATVKVSLIASST